MNYERILEPDPVDEDNLAKALEVPENFMGIAPHNVLYDAIRGGLQLYRVGEAILVTQQIQFPKGRVLNIYAIGGTGLFGFDEELDDVFKQIAREKGCRWITMMVGNAEVRRRVSRQGYKPVATMHVKEVTDA